MSSARLVMGLPSIQEFMARSPVTDMLSKSRLWRGAGRAAFSSLARMPWLDCNPLGALAKDQAHLAAMRLALPDVLAIPATGIEIGMGIAIRSLTKDKLEPEARKYFDHLTVLEITGRRSGLKAYLALHTMMSYKGRLYTIGGCRIRDDYSDLAAAQTDVLRLAEAMTYKCAAAEIPIGGSKTLVLSSARDPLIYHRLADLGRALEFLKTTMTGQDMNHTEEMVTQLALLAPHSIVGVTGLSMGGIPPTPPTAEGVFQAIGKAMELNGRQLRGLKVAVQGLGGVGWNLVSKLIKAGVVVYATDVKAETLSAARKEFGDGIIIVEPDAIYDTGADVFCPCAKGDVLNDDTIPRVVAAGYKFVIGGANNPLAKPPRHAQVLAEQGIIYYADFVTNAGGLMGVASDAIGYDTYEHLAIIPRTVAELDELMKKEDLNGFLAAQKLMEDLTSAICPK